MNEGLPLALVIGGGELGSAVAHRLVRSGIRVVVTDLPSPRCIRRKVCFAMALTEGVRAIEGVEGAMAADATEAAILAAQGKVPVVSDDFNRVAAELRPDAVIDARMLKTGEGIACDLAPLVIGLGPGFTAADNVDVVIETKRGHDLGRVIYSGSAQPDTGVPGHVGGFAAERVIRAPRSGTFRSTGEIGTLVRRGDVVGYVEDVDVKAPLDGLLRGLVGDGTAVREGRKMGDVDPRGLEIDPATISDRGRAVAGGVLEALMHWWTVKR
jgi:xanthine dehydrogenase accessory factor